MYARLPHEPGIPATFLIRCSAKIRIISNGQTENLVFLPLLLFSFVTVPMDGCRIFPQAMRALFETLHNRVEPVRSEEHTSELQSHKLISYAVFCLFFNDTATTEIYTLSLHDALPICIFSGVNVFFFLPPSMMENCIYLFQFLLQLVKIGRAHV